MIFRVNEIRFGINGIYITSLVCESKVFGVQRSKKFFTDQLLLPLMENYVNLFFLW